MASRTVSKTALATAAVAGALAGAALTAAAAGWAGIPWAAVSNPAFRKFFAAYSDLQHRYYQSLPVNTLVNGAVAGMANALGDPFTQYFPPSQAQSFSDMLSGSYVGIGAVVQAGSQGVEVVSVFPGSPAASAGLQPHDVFVRVDGKDVHGWTPEQVSHAILGPEGTQVTVTVHRAAADRDLTFTLTRRRVTQQTALAKVLHGDIGYLQIAVVSDHTASDVAQALQQLKAQKVHGVIVDVRDNPGGYLDQAVAIASQFIPKGKPVVKTVDRAGNTQVLTSQGPGLDLPVVVLMNAETASAAEILAAALHDDLGAPLVGTHSYGKGTMQETDGFADGSELKYTVGKWLTPAGDWVQGKGLQPTVSVDLPAYFQLPPLSTAALPLREGDNNNDVKTAQGMLAAIGDAADRSDGYYSAGTAAAVRRFQAQNGLPETGVIDSATAQRLQAQFQAQLEQSDTQLARAEQVAVDLASKR
ncbi:MAG: S41 family peptidase [Alicyclobacillus sp.]|nr:S41 family peptidase [Alicyclobacillus sp.]